MTIPSALASSLPRDLRSAAWMVSPLAAACLWSCGPVSGPSTGAQSTPPAATVTAGPPALPPDGPDVDPVCTSCVAAPVEWGYVGGLVFQRDSSTVEPCRRYRRTRIVHGRGGAEPPLSCSAMMSCDASETGAGKLRQLMSHPDVRRSFTDPMTVYGCDLRPVDGTLFGVELQDGRSFGVGGECEGCGMPGPRCVDPPAAVTELVAFLDRLDERMLSMEPCRSVFGPR